MARKNIDLATNPIAKNQWRAFYVARDMKLDDELTLALFEAVSAESRWRNLANDGKFGPEDVVGRDSTAEQLAEARKSMSMPNDGVGTDHASVGLLQQQVGRSFSWGSVEHAMTPELAMKTFVERAQGSKKRGTGAHRVAQDVQRSFDPTGSNYRAHEAAMTSMIERMGSECTR